MTYQENDHASTNFAKESTTVRWKKVILYPDERGSWRWAFKSVFFVPAIVRVLVTLKRSGIRDVFIYGTDESERSGTSGFADSDDAILLVKGGLFWQKEILEWFDDQIKSQTVAAMLGEMDNRFVLVAASIRARDLSRFTSLNGTATVSDSFPCVVKLPKNAVLLSSTKVLKNPALLLNLASKPSDRPHVVWVRQFLFPLLSFFASRGISPNFVTWFGFLVHIAGCAFLIVPSYVTGVIASIIFIFSWMLDCADGTLARLTLSESQQGQILDTRLGHLANVLLFMALIFRTFRYKSPLLMVLVGVAFIIGTTLAARTHSAVSSLAKEKSHEAASFFVKVNHRDYAFVLLVFALLNRLTFFCWLALFGVYGYWMSQLFVLLRTQKEEKHAKG